MPEHANRGFVPFDAAVAASVSAVEVLIAERDDFKTKLLRRLAARRDGGPAETEKYSKPIEWIESLCLPKTQIRVQRWCNPARTGTATIPPTS